MFQDCAEPRVITLLSSNREEEWDGDSTPFQASTVGGGALPLTQLAVSSEKEETLGAGQLKEVRCAVGESYEEVHGSSTRAEE